MPVGARPVVVEEPGPVRKVVEVREKRTARPPPVTGRRVVEIDAARGGGRQNVLVAVAGAVNPAAETRVGVEPAVPRGKPAAASERGVGPARSVRRNAVPAANPREEIPRRVRLAVGVQGLGVRRAAGIPIDVLGVRTLPVAGPVGVEAAVAVGIVIAGVVRVFLHVVDRAVGTVTLDVGEVVEHLAVRAAITANLLVPLVEVPAFPGTVEVAGHVHEGDGGKVLLQIRHEREVRRDVGGRGPRQFAAPRPQYDVGPGMRGKVAPRRGGPAREVGIAEVLRAAAVEAPVVIDKPQRPARTVRIPCVGRALPIRKARHAVRKLAAVRGVAVDDAELRLRRGKGGGRNLREVRTGVVDDDRRGGPGREGRKERQREKHHRARETGERKIHDIPIPISTVPVKPRTRARRF